MEQEYSLIYFTSMYRRMSEHFDRSEHLLLLTLQSILRIGLWSVDSQTYEIVCLPVITLTYYEDMLTYLSLDRSWFFLPIKDKGTDFDCWRRSTE